MTQPTYCTAFACPLVRHCVRHITTVGGAAPEGAKTERFIWHIVERSAPDTITVRCPGVLIEEPVT